MDRRSSARLRIHLYRWRRFLSMPAPCEAVSGRPIGGLLSRVPCVSTEAFVASAASMRRLDSGGRLSPGVGRPWRGGPGHRFGRAPLGSVLPHFSRLGHTAMAVGEPRAWHAILWPHIRVGKGIGCAPCPSKATIGGLCRAAACAQLSAALRSQDSLEPSSSKGSPLGPPSDLDRWGSPLARPKFGQPPKMIAQSSAAEPSVPRRRRPGSRAAA